MKMSNPSTNWRGFEGTSQTNSTRITNGSRRRQEEWSFSLRTRTDIRPGHTSDTEFSRLLMDSPLRFQSKPLTVMIDVHPKLKNRSKDGTSSSLLSLTSQDRRRKINSSQAEPAPHRQHLNTQCMFSIPI
jgi:hypothetical protein